MRKLITYEEALKLVEKYDNMNFSKNEFTIDGYKVVLFKYFLCGFEHFERPIENSDIHGYDMRGITFVFNKDGSLYKRFLMLPKFFNLNQVEDTQYGLVKNKKINSIIEKEDGSLIAFMNLPNGKVFAKTIGSFNNEQIDSAMALYNKNVYLRNYVKMVLQRDFTPLFEYVSLCNRIVLRYGDPELIFLGVRNNINGTFINSKDFVYQAPVKTPEFIKNKSLDDLIKLSETVENKEGWVVEFEDGQMIKVKTNWYFRFHVLRTENVFREDFIIESYLNEKIDDVYSQLDKNHDSDAFKFIKRVISAVDNKMKYIDEVVKVVSEDYYWRFDENWDAFATKHHNAPFFGLIVTFIKNRENYQLRKIEYLINKTKHLKKAQDFVDKWTNEKDEIISKWKNV